MSTRDRSGRGRSRWNAEDDMDIENSDDERKSRQHTLREGILYPHSCYYQFLIKWTSEMTTKNPLRPLLLIEKITPVTELERDRINLPPHEKADVIHCDITIKSLPPSVFFGSGYGPERKTAYFAAAKDLMDKCLKMGLITRDLHEAIGSKPVLEQNRRLPDFVRAIDVVMHLDSLIRQARWSDNVETKRSVSQMDFTILDTLVAESRERVYGANAPVYDASFCGLCKRKSHMETCPYGMEEKRLAKLKKDQEERERGRERRRSRSRSRERRDAAREQKEAERIEIERKIMAQREALMKEDEERKLKEATERARAAAMAFGGGALPVMGGPGAAPLVTPGLSGAANPLGAMMGGGLGMHHPYPQHQFMPTPFHSMGGGGPSPEMAASMAQMAQMMGGGGGYGGRKEGVSVPTGYAAHVAQLEEGRVRVAAEEMMRLKEREEEERRAKTEAALRAELEARLHEEIEQKKAALEMELRQRMVPREARRLGVGNDMGATMSTYGVMPAPLPAPAPLPTPMNPYGGGGGAMMSHSSLNPYSMQQEQQQQQSYGVPHSSMMVNPVAFGAPPHPYSTAAAMPPVQQQMQQPQQEFPELLEIKILVSENADRLKNLAYARDPTLASHPVLARVATLNGQMMDQMELRNLRDELKDFLAMLQRKVENGRKKPEEVKMERGREDRERQRRVDEERRRRRSRSRSHDKGRHRNRDGRGEGRMRGGEDGRTEERRETTEASGGGGVGGSEIEQEEVIVQVGTSRFRQLRAKEAMLLKKDDVVVAQDLKNGRWSTAKVLRVSDKRVQLVVGNAQWKKEFNEVYRPI